MRATLELKLEVSRSPEGSTLRYRVKEGRRWREFTSVLELAAYLEKLARHGEGPAGLK